MDKTLIDIRVFHPGAPSNAILPVPNMYKKHEDEKKRTYNRRIIEVEKATFTPLVFSTSGGMGKEAVSFHKRLALLISLKRGDLYSNVMSYVRKRISFTILKATLLDIRGFRGKTKTQVGIPENSDLNLIPLHQAND